ncbi:hypothetical protein TorRG33x02_353960 [Trema orientale]|uniref:Uncharacterized protein n=1 Tax=Trema orientale TaxID=63057 RepID=A0A2P5AC29_TREOI|nr:hypothetical protein TorRG33x02_353960 [Trema orientale]
MKSFCSYAATFSSSSLRARRRKGQKDGQERQAHWPERVREKSTREREGEREESRGWGVRVSILDREIKSVLENKRGLLEKKKGSLQTAGREEEKGFIILYLSSSFH